MTSPTTSTNPFRRNGPLAPAATAAAPTSMTPTSPSPSPSTLSLRPALISPSVFDPDADTTASEASGISASLRSKAPKKVRVQSPPVSPRVIGPTPSTSLQSLETASEGEDEDPFVADDDFEEVVEWEINREKARAERPAKDETLYNPFSKTLKTLQDPPDQVHPEPPRASSNALSAPKGHAARASLDVEAFKRLLLTGSSGLEPSPIPASASPGASSDSRSPADEHSYTSTHPHNPHAIKKPPPPPSSRHGRSIKSVDLSSVSPVVSPRKVTPTTTALDISTASTPLRSPVTPPPPRRRGESRSVSEEPTPAPAPPVETHTKSPPRSDSCAPAPPPPRRPAQKSAPVSPALQHATVISTEKPETTSPPPVISPHGRAKPPPPPARHSSARRPQSLALSGQPDIERKASGISRRPPPPVIPRALGGSKGSEEGMATATATATAKEEGEHDYMAELTALQREVEAAMKGRR